MTNEQRELSVVELFKETYSRLGKRHSALEVNFPHMFSTEIADDSDWHRTRKGIMLYSAANLFSLNGKGWALAVGDRTSGYPAEGYDGDILALEFSLDGKSPENILGELKQGINCSSYFINTLVYGANGGRLAVTEKNRFGKKCWIY